MFFAVRDHLEVIILSLMTLMSISGAKRHDDKAISSGIMIQRKLLDEGIRSFMVSQNFIMRVLLKRYIHELY